MNLASFRAGWESEYLAQYILSRFSFVARPISVGDDVGSDFYCTIFERVKKEGKPNIFLAPRSSFAIQIKSKGITKKGEDLTNKIDYLRKLELPFFFGVVNDERMSLTIYSGDYLPHFFSEKGGQKEGTTLKAVLSDRKEYEAKETNPLNYELCFSRIGEIKADISRDELDQFASNFLMLCRRMQNNILARNTHHYFFESLRSGQDVDELRQGGVLNLHVFAGRSSYETIRPSFAKRLAELFRNLYWVFQAENVDDAEKERVKEEFLIYKDLYEKLSEIDFEHHPVADMWYNLLCRELDREN